MSPVEGRGIIGPFAMELKVLASDVAIMRLSIQVQVSFLTEITSRSTLNEWIKPPKLFTMASEVLKLVLKGLDDLCICYKSGCVMTPPSHSFPT